MSLVINKKAVSFSEAVKIISDKMALHNDQPDKNRSIKRVSVEIPNISILDWLSHQKHDEKIYWSTQDDSFETAGLGSWLKIRNGEFSDHSHLFDYIEKQLLTADEHVRFYGGFKFDPALTLDKDWQAFGQSCFVLPKIELLRVNSKYFLAANLIDGDKSIMSEIESLVFKIGNDFDNNYTLSARTDCPDYKNWLEIVKEAKANIENGQYEKIVLARKTVLNFEEKLNLIGILKNLKERSANCFHFLFQPNENIGFLGASPERLYRRLDRIVRCEAIAGTGKRGETDNEDKTLGQNLLKSSKDINEHRFVIDSIIESISSFTDDDIKPEQIEINLLKLARIQHLWGRLKFKIKDSVKDVNLINSLHPTAAVGGYPKDYVMNDIYKLEKFDRGWYAAPFGWIGKNSAEFVVAIRSGLIKNNKISLYSGAGIVSDSVAEDEWEEIENKISNILKVLS